MAFPVRLDVPPELLNASPEYPDVLGPALPAAQGRRFAGLQAARRRDVRPQLDGLPAALSVAEACRNAAAALTKRFAPQAELWPAGLASAQMEQHSERMQRGEQHLLAEPSQGGVVVLVRALLPVPEAWLPQAEPVKKLRPARDAQQAALQQAALRLAWPLQQQRLSVFQRLLALPRLPARGNAFLLFQPGRDPANSSASSFQ